MSKISISTKKTPMFKVGMGLLIATIPLWLSPLYIVFTPFSVSQKVAIVVACMVIAEIFFWVGALLVGREVMQRYKDRLDPRKWAKRS